MFLANTLNPHYPRPDSWLLETRPTKQCSPLQMLRLKFALGSVSKTVDMSKACLRAKVAALNILIPWFMVTPIGNESHIRVALELISILSIHSRVLVKMPHGCGHHGPYGEGRNYIWIYLWKIIIRISMYILVHRDVLCKDYNGGHISPTRGTRIHHHTNIRILLHCPTQEVGININNLYTRESRGLWVSLFVPTTDDLSCDPAFSSTFATRKWRMTTDRAYSRCTSASVSLTRQPMTPHYANKVPESVAQFTSFRRNMPALHIPWHSAENTPELLHGLPNT